ncbi:hypothetical protein L1987_09606 [Smallanthus sonchifolius]|uniref:Uncharacterized protein n=1 Tax=Smallanthus sonchifolius TaxID=185202 RepID=A0ACB9JPP8_9ASTR|nr:hypothetical protein L1987_09606 [Smallanthus sonchifolius]
MKVHSPPPFGFTIGFLRLSSFIHQNPLSVYVNLSFNFDSPLFRHTNPRYRVKNYHNNLPQLLILRS